MTTRPRLGFCRIGCCIAGLLTLLSGRPVAAQTTYSITDLGSLVPGLSSRATGINNRGQVVGSSNLDSSSSLQHAFVWTAGVMSDLGAIPGTGNSSYANAINDAGQVVGASVTAGGLAKAVRWTNGALTILDNVNQRSEATAIDPAGRAVGSLNTRAIMWPQPGSTTDLGVPDSSWATGINTRGQISGVFRTNAPGGGTGFAGFLAQSGTWTELSSNNPDRPDARPEAINISGLVVGVTRQADGVAVATVWDQHTNTRELVGGTCQPGLFSLTGVNAAGQAVGGPCVGMAGQPYLDTFGPDFVDLNTRIPAGSGWVLQRASGINDSGQIVGTGVKDGVVHRGFLLTPSFRANINFQPSNAPVPAGYVADTGAAFGTRGNGLSYGWNVGNAMNMRDRNSAVSLDQRYDTFAHMQNGTGGTRWEIALANGTYLVHLVAGDPIAFNSTHLVNIEGALFQWGIPHPFGDANPDERWFEGTNLVVVSDGRLTITNAAGSQNNKISYIDIIRN